MRSSIDYRRPRSGRPPAYLATVHPETLRIAPKDELDALQATRPDRLPHDQLAAFSRQELAGPRFDLRLERTPLFVDEERLVLVDGVEMVEEVEPLFGLQGEPLRGDGSPEDLFRGIDVWEELRLVEASNIAPPGRRVACILLRTSPRPSMAIHHKDQETRTTS